MAHWPRAAARLARLPRLRPIPSWPPDLRPPWRPRAVAGQDPAPGPPQPDRLRVSWLVIMGGFAALAALILFWVAITAVRSVTGTLLP
jgi:hypothetical protein